MALDKLSSEELREFTERYSNLKFASAPESSTASTSVIPRFFDRLPAEEAGLEQKLREEARSKFLQRRNLQLMDNEELKQVWALLEEHHVPPVVDDERSIDYRRFLVVRDAVSPKARRFFTAEVFSKLQQKDPYGRIAIVPFFSYLMRSTWLRQSRIGLSLYDVTGQGFLTEKDLELYISEQIPTLPQLERLEEAFHSFYVCTAVRRFFFFLDPKRLNKLRIVDILASGFLDDLLELRETAVTSPPTTGTEATPRDSDENDTKNWFSAANALRVYGQYLNLDTDRNGMLSPQELKHYGTGMLTDAFIERLFQECLTYEGEMDYKAYLDFVLAMENKKDRASLQFFFRILDVRHRGFLDAFAINFFFRDIQTSLKSDDQPMVLFEDIKDEIFDMVKPKDPLRITLRDLIDSKQGETVVNVLTDLDGFWKYENREYLATEQDEEELD